ncbi:MAG: hypothetical protein AB2693_30250 [Candidatus Thiodiazotropha sp.]
MSTTLGAFSEATGPIGLVLTGPKISFITPNMVGFPDSAALIPSMPPQQSD